MTHNIDDYDDDDNDSIDAQKALYERTAKTELQKTRARENQRSLAAELRALRNRPHVTPTTRPIWDDPSRQIVVDITPDDPTKK